MDTCIRNFSILAALSVAMVLANNANAQCSGGGAGGSGGGRPAPPTGSISQFVPLYSQADLLAYERRIAYRQQQYAYQQQQLAMQRQRSSGAAERLDAERKQAEQQKQNVYAVRLEWAEAKRAKRKERIAARIAERLHQSSGSDIVASQSETTLVSLQEANPFQ